jgi:hypothetical protein
MIDKLRKTLVVPLMLIPLASGLLTITFSKWNSFSGVLLFSFCFLVLALVASLVGLYKIRLLISKLAETGEYMVEQDFMDQESIFVSGFTNGYVQKMIVKYSDLGLIIVFKYSKKKQPLMIPWQEIKSYETIDEDNLVCFEFSAVDVKLYVPYKDELTQFIEKMIGGRNE